ncbi:MAG TPA: penicillin-binding transpeptidase domain-containing protein [Verrucomicrobiae bacterium]|nr:penicillin-binding transpeptidase domain-containing protein [Verrucomicrobiae bacterium]
MFILDELKKNDPRLRLVAGIIAAGLFILLAGLWWVQIVSARKYQSHLETQTYRTVRIPAVRGKILDREGRVLAGNRPSYNLCLYLNDLRGQFQDEYARLRPVKIVTNSPPFWKFWSSTGTVVTQRVRLSKKQIDAWAELARYNVASNVVSQIGRKLGESLFLNPVRFEQEYQKRLALPYTVISDATPEQVARFEEQGFAVPGADVELQAVRDYPLGTIAGHLLGYLVKNDPSRENPDNTYDYFLPDYHGVIGIEWGFNSVLSGRAGLESVLVNNYGYRQSENILKPAQPGENVVLTIDLDIQRAAAESLLNHQEPDGKAAVVVMDVHSGDILAMVSSPAINPNSFVTGLTPAEWQRFNDTNLLVQYNRATQVPLAPGSIFKPIVGLAALQNGLNPNAIVDNPGYKYVGRRRIQDEAPPGQYNLQRAIAYSCNTYFVTEGLNTGITNIIRMAEKFHFGERVGLPIRQETDGLLPTLSQVGSPDWHDGNSANICIGQGQLDVTPLQMAVAYSAIANGGLVFWPRLVECIEPQGPAPGQTLTNFPSGLVRDRLGVGARNLEIVREAMLKETEEGTGQAAQVSGLKICGKTGTAQVMNSRDQEIGRTVWFASFAPYENPRYAVVVMRQGGIHIWGRDCAPIAHDIYEAILKKEESTARGGVARK